MKVCANCENEIATRDGINECQACRNTRKRAQRRANAKAKREVMESLGLTRVRGALGGIYYE